MRFYVEIWHQDFGKLRGETLEGSKEQYDRLLEYSRGFYTTEEFYEMYLEDGSFVILDSNNIKKSIILIGVEE